MERKVQVGDTVDVDGVVGRVTSVDIRASTVLGFDGVETMIPNATFLETKVTNWTHTSATLRRSVRVGVAYGSPVARVRDILAECAEHHGQVLKSPPPLVLFEEFGDSSLIFVLYFWIDYGPAVNPLKVASDLRFMIERRFGETNIVMAFPQRDIHLSGVHPLRVELVEPNVPGQAS
jgi:small-conductance mechanosensitive channel